MFACVCVSVCITVLTICDRLTCWPTAPLAQCNTANTRTRTHAQRETEKDKTFFISILSASNSLSSLSHSAASSSSSSSHHHFLKYLALPTLVKSRKCCHGNQGAGSCGNTSPEHHFPTTQQWVWEFHLQQWLPTLNPFIWAMFICSPNYGRSRTNWLMMAHLFAYCCFFTVWIYYRGRLSLKFTINGMLMLKHKISCLHLNKTKNPNKDLLCLRRGFLLG